MPRILLLVTSFNGLSRRVWAELRERGYRVRTVEVADLDAAGIEDTVRGADPDWILAPFLKQRVPESVFASYPTVVFHPGPLGDRGPSSLDYAILDAERRWGITAFSPVEEMDAGPVWAHREFALPVSPMSKSAIYNGPVSDAVLDSLDEILTKLATGIVPADQRDLARPIASARTRPPIRRTERLVDWTSDSYTVLRTIKASDSSPGAPTDLGGQRYHVVDAAVGRARPDGVPPGTVVERNGDFVAIAAQDALVWVGQAQVPKYAGGQGISLPAARVVPADVPDGELPFDLREATYVRRGRVGVVTFRAHNGAMHTDWCCRALAVLREAKADDTDVLVVRGTADYFSNGIHLKVIEGSPDPAREAWDNIVAINELCHEIIAARQITLTAFTAGAGAGGVMLGLASDHVVARAGIVLNPYYDIGLFGSELHTFTLPRRVGDATAAALLADNLPIGARAAQRIGLVDAVGPRDPIRFDAWMVSCAENLLAGRPKPVLSRDDLAALQDAERRELKEMAVDIFADGRGFSRLRKEFVG